MQSSPLIASLVLASNDGKGGISSALPGLASGVYPPGLSAKNATAFGEKLFTAARDGVERIGSGAGTPSPVLGPSARDASTERAAEGDAKTSMNENLRNIGKFFRRDISTGLTGRFGGKGAGADGS